MNPKHKDPKWVRRLSEKGMDPKPWREYKQGWPKAWKACKDLKVLVSAKLACSKDPVDQARGFAAQVWAFTVYPLQAARFIKDYGDAALLRKQTHIYAQVCNDGLRGLARLDDVEFKAAVQELLRPVDPAHRFMFEDVRDVLVALNELQRKPDDYERYAHVINQMSFLDGRRTPEAYQSLLEKFAALLSNGKAPVLS